MSEQQELLPCPFCGGKGDPSGWMNVGGVTGPECQDCGATALDLGSWNHRIHPHPHPPGEASEDGVDAMIVALLSADPELNHATLVRKVRNNREIVRRVRAGAPHDGDCIGKYHTCFVCLVSEYERKARAIISALPAPPEREALKRGLEQCNDYLNDPRWNSMIRMAAGAIRSALLCEKK